MASKRKTTSAVIAVALAAAILLGGTFAWQSISQEALNEVYGFVNPGGRLHDDFHEITYDENGNVAKDANDDEYTTRHFDKNVYVENFTTVLEDGVQIFARVRLDEYMEVGKGAGTTGDGNEAKSIDITNPKATYENKSEWRTRLPSDTDNPFQKYWDWTMAGQGENGTLGESTADGVNYMPTFNKNKDSVVADVNGTFDGIDGKYNEGKPFDDYVDYDDANNHRKTANAVYDNDPDENDELWPTGDSTLENAVANGYVTTEEETHEIAKTLTSKVITMEEWLNNPVTGDFWVWDEDGWAYWANPINPDSATGIFLDGIARTPEIINEEWYYGINVVAQFITSDHLGRENGDGFYSDRERVPSYNALKLLNTIGVTVNTTVSDADTLDAALALGGDITLDGNTVMAETSSTPVGEGYPMSFFWPAGGTLSDGTLNVDKGDVYAGLFINNENNWPVNGDGAAAAVVENVTIVGSVGYGVYAQAIDAPITLNRIIIKNTAGGGLLAEQSGNTVTLNNCTINVPATDDASAVAGYQQTAVAVAKNGNVVINSGNYTGLYALYAYSSNDDDNGVITVNGGTFNGALKVDTGKLIIKGGTFTVDPTAYVPEGYTVEKSTDAEGNVVSWTVSEYVF